jgi:hypothetical protein
LWVKEIKIFHKFFPSKKKKKKEKNSLAKKKKQGIMDIEWNV